jgi:Ca2+-binding RTX toxin-like protein
MVITGTSADETLQGTEFDDSIDGMGGNDTLEGLAGADAFHYAFTVTLGESSTFSGWLAEKGLEPLADGTTKQNVFSKQYTKWLSSLVKENDLGTDVDGNGKVSVDINQNDPDGTPIIEGMTPEELTALFGDRQSLDVKTGKKTHERWFSDSATLGSDATTGDGGMDVISDFDAAEGDTLQMTGITLADFEATFTITETDVDADTVLDTVITLDTDASWSLTLAGVSGFDPATAIVFA